jgi:hypothetical protein
MIEPGTLTTNTITPVTIDRLMSKLASMAAISGSAISSVASRAPKPAEDLKTSEERPSCLRAVYPRVSTEGVFGAELGGHSQ